MGVIIVECLEEMKASDAAELAALYRSLMPEIRQDESWISQLFEELRGLPDHHLICVRMDGKIVGTALAVCGRSMAMQGKRFLILEDVVVREDLRGCGIGKLLMQYAESLGVRENCWAVMLLSAESRRNAHYFYKACGYCDPVAGFRKVFCSLDSLE